MKTTYYCLHGCNVFETAIEFDVGPDCAACGRIMTTDQEAFEDAHERRELEQISEIEREMARYHVQYVPVREEGSRRRHSYRVHLRGEPDRWVLQTNPDLQIGFQKRTARTAAKALSDET